MLHVQISEDDVTACITKSLLHQTVNCACGIPLSITHTESTIPYVPVTLGSEVFLSKEDAGEE